MAIRKMSSTTCPLLKVFCFFVFANFAGSAPVEVGVGVSSGCARDPCKVIAGVCGGKACISTANCGFRCADGGAGSTNAAVIREKHFQVNPVESLDVSLFGTDSLSADDHHEPPTTVTTTTPRTAKGDSFQTTLSVIGSTSAASAIGTTPAHKDNVVTPTPNGGRNLELNETTSPLPPASGAPVSTIGTDSLEVDVLQQERPGPSTLRVPFKDVGLTITTNSPTENLKVSTDISNNLNTTKTPSTSGDISQSGSLSSGTKSPSENSSTKAKSVTSSQAPNGTPPSTTKASVNGVSAPLGDDVRERNATIVTPVPGDAPRDVKPVQVQKGAPEVPVLPASSTSESNITGKEIGLADITSRLIDIIGKIQELYGRSNDSTAAAASVVKGPAAKESPTPDSKARLGTSGLGTSAGGVTSADKLSVGSVTAVPAATASATNSSIMTEVTTEGTTEASFPSLMDTFQTLTKGSSNGALTRIVSRVHYVDEGFGMLAP